MQERLKVVTLSVNLTLGLSVGKKRDGTESCQGSPLSSECIFHGATLSSKSYSRLSMSVHLAFISVACWVRIRTLTVVWLEGEPN